MGITSRTNATTKTRRYEDLFFFVRSCLRGPGSLLLFLQEQTPERRDDEAQRLIEAVGDDRFGGGPAAVDEIAAAVEFGIAVQPFRVPPGFRDADAIVVARHGGEV